MSNRKKIKSKSGGPFRKPVRDVDPDAVNSLLREVPSPSYGDELSSDRATPLPHLDERALAKREAIEKDREFIRNLHADRSIALTVAEVCALLKISRSTLYRADLPGKVMIGGCVRYDKMKILGWWLDQHKKTTVEPSP